jgi:hypothetical protein
MPRSAKKDGRRRELKEVKLSEGYYIMAGSYMALQRQNESVSLKAVG